MSDLSTLLDRENRPVVVADITSLVDGAITDLSGITGMTVRGALSAARKTNGDLIPTAVDNLLPDILGDLQSHWEDYQQSGQQDFGAFLESRADDVSESLLSTADPAVEQKGGGAVAKVYNSLRGRGTKLMAPHIPALGRIIDNHMR